jgi:amidohydrolase
MVARYNEQRGTGLRAIIDRYRPDLQPFEMVYKDIHRHPELGTQESRTASIAAEHLKALGFTVHEKIGGHGVVGVFHNGQGLVLLLRADMDALPILEQTGLPYASKVMAKDPSGVLRPVMHACGHDTHVASMMAAASLLQAAKATWSGTLLFCFQPNEEHGRGAKAMVEDGLYSKVPRPDIVLGQHVTQLKTGIVAIREGPVMAAADSFDVRIFGRGGHGSQPENTIDPVVIASYIVVRLQSIVSREVTPGKLAVITCGSLHGGETENVIPDYVDLKLNVRTYDPAVRDHTLAAIKRIIEAECQASGVEKKPSIIATTTYPVTNNSSEIVTPLKKTFKDYFGDKLWDMGQNLASEDISIFATSIGVPYAYWYFGGTDAQKWDDANKKGQLATLIPGNHSSHFAPVIEPTLETAIDAISLAVLTFLAKYA